MTPRLQLRPSTLNEARAFIAEHHRHCRPLRGCRFTLAAELAGRLVAVAVIGRPSARHLDDQTTAEITRLCASPDAPRGACSYLYQAARRAWQAMGGRRVLTYTLEAESGASLRGAGFTPEALAAARAWKDRPGADRAARPAKPTDRHRKRRWSAPCSPPPARAIGP